MNFEHEPADKIWQHSRTQGQPQIVIQARITSFFPSCSPPFRPLLLVAESSGSYTQETLSTLPQLPGIAHQSPLNCRMWQGPDQCPATRIGGICAHTHPSYALLECRGSGSNHHLYPFRVLLSVPPLHLRRVHQFFRSRLRSQMQLMKGSDAQFNWKLMLSCTSWSCESADGSI